MTHTLTLTSIAPVTHDTWHLTFDHPKGFQFEPGQATHWALDEDGWRDKDRPFTMTSDPKSDVVEFVIKSYPDHDGVTGQIPLMTPGDKVIAEDPAGAITDHGTGVFLAAGAGITPFIAILDKHSREDLTGDRLIFANKADRDIILKDKWDAMDGVKPTYVISDQPDTAHAPGRIDKGVLQDLLHDLDQTFYICGPGGFVDAMRDALADLSVPKDKMVIESGW
jgi:ferredoxin-NADP reductase